MTALRITAERRDELIELLTETLEILDGPEHPAFKSGYACAAVIQALVHLGDQAAAERLRRDNAAMDARIAARRQGREV